MVNFVARSIVFSALLVAALAVAMTYSVMSTGSHHPGLAIAAAWTLLAVVGCVGVTVLLVRTDATQSKVWSAATDAAALLAVFTGGFLTCTWTAALAFAGIFYIRSGESPWPILDEHVKDGWKLTILAWVLLTLLSWLGNQSAQRRGGANRQRAA